MPLASEREPVRGQVGRGYDAECVPIYIWRARQKCGYSPSKWANPFKVSRGLSRTSAVLRFEVSIDVLDLLEIADEVAMTALQSAGLPEAAHLARARHGARGVPRSEDMSVSRALKSPALGEFVDCELGMISPPPPKDFTYKLVIFSLYTLDREKVTQRWLQVLAGRWVRAMMFRREAMSAFDHLWQAVVRWEGKRRLPCLIFREIFIALGLLPFMRCDLRTPISGLVTVSDASEQKGAVRRAVRLLPHGVAAARAARARRGGRLQDEGALISLFDGVGGVGRALDMLGLSIAVHAASETDAGACRVVRHAWPDVMELGDAQLLVEKDVRIIRDHLARLSVDRRGLQGKRSGLFFEILRAQALMRRVFPEEVQLFNLIEHASFMEAKDRQAMSQAPGLQPAVIEAADSSRARRERLYWCDRDLATPWQVVVDEMQEAKSFVIPGGAGDLKRWLRESRHWCGTVCEEQRLPTFARCAPRACAGYKPKGLRQCSEEELARWRTHEYCYAPYQFRDAHGLRWDGGDLEPADSLEREMPMDFPPGRTATARAARFRRTRELEAVRCALLGSSFQRAVVAWILGHWAHCQKYLDDAPTDEQLRQQGGGFDASEGAVRMAADNDEGALIHHKDLRGREAQQDMSAQMVEEMVRRAEVRGSDVRLVSLEMVRPDL
ncbi:unnamed protein product [Prorocentrum cordatum]|uniref:Uncharacterized protein n=1 Tax=Prorocentrum cordatum TaxID=2364126 RepID=A0ABN9VXU3_9DINO|nr:unnamed protein product [Polarella glacialis]